MKYAKWILMISSIIAIVLGLWLLPFSLAEILLNLYSQEWNEANSLPGTGTGTDTSGWEALAGIPLVLGGGVGVWFMAKHWNDFE